MNNKVNKYLEKGNELSELKRSFRTWRRVIKHDITGKHYHTFCERLRLKKAIKYYDKAIKIDPLCAQAWLSKASLYGVLKNKNQMIKSLKEAITLDNEYKSMFQTSWVIGFEEYMHDPDFLELIK